MRGKVMDCAGRFRLVAAGRVFDAEEPALLCQAISKYQQTVEKSIKELPPGFGIDFSSSFRLGTNMTSSVSHQR